MKTINSIALLILPAVLISACGGDKQITSDDWGDRPRLEYSYPYAGQQAVSTRAPLVLRFSHPLTDTAPEDAVTWEDETGEPVPFSASLTEDGRSLVLSATGPLKPLSSYQVSVGTLDSEGRQVRLPDMPLTFMTRDALSGPREARALPGPFALARLIPDGDTQPVMDFSAFRLQFSQPLARDTVRYGDTLFLEDAGGDLVPARVLVQGNYVTLDPEQDLSPGGSYTLRATSALQSLYGEALEPVERALVALDSAPRETLVQRAGDSAEGTLLSPLTGMPINNVPVNARLLGDQSSSQQQGDVFAELAYIPNFPDAAPLRVARGALLEGSAVQVNIAGEVPAGFGTGDIEVRFISDAMGYLVKNPYVGPADIDSPRHIRLFMDVAMTAEDPQANGALSQDLLHVELAGTAMVEDGQLVINAIGVVEPRVLGLEQAWGILSFRLESYRDQLNAPAPVPDTTPPTLQSWVPDAEADAARPGDPVILNFSEAIDPASVEGAVTLERDNAPIAHDWRLDGASLVLYPQDGLQFGSDYRVILSSQLTDVAGNALADEVLEFAMPVYQGSGNRAPMALTVYPGYPCAKQDASLDGTEAEHQGRCVGGQGGDDRLPVERLPGARSIEVQFSQNMDASSIVLGEHCGEGTFRVERLDAAGNCTGVVEGRLERHTRSLRFTPDTPWETEALYRYVLASAQNPTGCGNDAICAEFGYPLQTALLLGRPGNQGGPNLVNHFRGGPDTGDVLQHLVNLPTSDVNANYAIDPGEASPQPDPERPGYYIVPDNAAELRVNNTSGLLLDANVGCGFTGGGYSPGKQTCNDEKFLYITGGLTADVVDYDPAEDAVRVNIRPTVIMTTSIDVHALLLLLIIPDQTVIPTGPQVMRLRYEEDEQGRRTRPITGWLYEGPDGPRLRATLQLYLDAPNLAPSALGITLTHDLYSYPLTLEVDGPVEFMPDGRMVIRQTNIGGPSDITASISLLGIGAAGMTLRIPEEGMNLTFLSRPVKD
ncbi:Ig-like domain-containing protein [Isoalcanivorax indicus]|uniref:Ig-like domain-containing protein n=1 Tax=Isoalcanivorax indicus TaxID=2202653 RepID=UPI000DBAB8BC|nr:Ig-like domain-containing protein [Isoalcanivorax indicus]